jgi:hypothetical protein
MKPDIPAAQQPQQADAETDANAQRANVEIPQPAAGPSPNAPKEEPPTAPPPGSGPGVPWWFWLLSFLIIFGCDAALVLALVAQHQNLAVAAGVPSTLTLVALLALRALANHMNPPS